MLTPFFPRKFLSLLFSIWYFSNPFTPLHWAGTSLVFGGTLLFSDIPGLLRQAKEAGAGRQELGVKKES